VYGWGANQGSNLGLNHGNPIFTPVKISGLSGKQVQQISTSTEHTVIRLDDGTVLGSGRNLYGALGPLADLQVFTVLDQPEGAEWVTAAGLRTYFSRNGQVYAMGDNEFALAEESLGALGIGYLSPRRIEVPLPVTDLAEGIRYGPKEPIVHEIALEDPYRFRIVFDLPPFTYSNRLFLEIYELGADEPTRTEMHDLEPGALAGQLRVITDELPAGTYIFKIYTSDFVNEFTFDSSDVVIMDADGTGYTLQGIGVTFTLRLRDPDGEPLSGYNVSLREKTEPYQIVTQTTGSDGTAAFAGRLPGQYYVIADHNGKQYLFGEIFLVNDVSLTRTIRFPS